MSFKGVLLLVAIGLIGFYRFAFPWTPLWVDLIVVAIAIGLLIASKSADHDRQESVPQDHEGEQNKN